MSITTGTFPGVRIVDMPDLGAVNDSSSVVGERAGSGRFGAVALRNYIGQPTAVSVRLFGAVGDGVADDTFAIQAAIDSLSAYGGGVALPPGIYRITVAIRMRAGIVLQGNGGATIKQGNGANLAAMIEFNSYSAANATITGLTLDGNSANNVGGDGNIILMSAQPGTQVANCTITNAPGMGLFLQGFAPVVIDNEFSNIFGIGVMLWGAVANTNMSAHVANNDFTNVGYFAINPVWADYNVITGNSITGPSLLHHVSTSGTTVTWVSGTQFTNLRAGMFIRFGPSTSPTEAQIGSIQSATTMTLTASVPTLTNVAANTGQADIINIDSCAYNVVTENSLQGGMSGGIVIHNTKGTASTIATIVANNSCVSIGNMGITIQTPTVSTTVDTTIIKGNVCTNCGVGGAANATNTSNGIWISGAQARNTLIAGNLCNGFSGGNQLWGIRVAPEVPAGQTTVTGNRSVNNATGDVFGAGWLTYSPGFSALSGAFSNATATGRYRLFDKTVQWQVTVAITANGTAANAIQISLPLTSSTAAGAYFAAYGRSAVGSKSVSGIIGPGSTLLSFANYDGSYPGSNGETISVCGTYEVD